MGSTNNDLCATRAARQRCRWVESIGVLGLLNKAIWLRVVVDYGAHERENEMVLWTPRKQLG